MYKAIIFDFFDVVHRDPFHHWLRQNGLERAGTLEETARLFDLGEIDLEEHHQRVSRASGKPIGGVRASFKDTSFIDAEMVALIQNLKRSYKTGLLSNSGTEYIDQILEQHGLRRLFDVITVSSEVKMVKPDPRIFQHVLDKLAVTAGEAAFVDDNPRNVEAATRLGIKGLVYDGNLAKLKRELSAAGINV